MTPSEKLNNIKQSIGVNTIEKFPENVATEVDNIEKGEEDSSDLWLMVEYNVAEKSSK